MLHVRRPGNGGGGGGGDAVRADVCLLDPTRKESEREQPA